MEIALFMKIVFATVSLLSIQCPGPNLKHKMERIKMHRFIFLDKDKDKTSITCAFTCTYIAVLLPNINSLHSQNDNLVSG